MVGAIREMDGPCREMVGASREMDGTGVVLEGGRVAELEGGEPLDAVGLAQGLACSRGRKNGWWLVVVCG